MVTPLHPPASGLSRLGRPAISGGTKLATPAAIVLLVWLTGSVLGLGSLSFAEPDEPRFAEATRQMFLRGDFLTPYFNGIPRFEKPILFYWMQAITFAVIGPGETAARLPSALAGLGCLLLTFAIGRRLLGETAGLTGAVVLATTFRFVVWTRQGLTDIPVMFFIMAALYAWLRALDEPAHRRALALAGWSAVGLAALTKGPVAVLPVLILAAYLIATRQWQGFRGLHVPSGVLVSAAITVPWYAWMMRLHGRAFVDFALGYEILARYGYAGATFPSANRSFLWYAAIYPGDAAPWTLFVAAGAALAVWRFRRCDPAERRALVFLATWFGTVIAVFASAQFKVTHYILPAYPAASLFAGYLIDRATSRSDPAPALLWRLPFGLTIAALAAITAILALFMHRVFGTPWLSDGMAGPFVLAFATIAAIVFGARGRRLKAFSALAGGVAVATACLAAITAPRDLQRYQPMRALGERVAPLAPAGDRIGLYGRFGASSLIYYGRHNIVWIDAPEQAAAFMSADNRRFLVIPEADFPAVDALYDPPLYVIERGTFFNVRLKRLFDERIDTEDRPMLLVSNRPLSSPAESP